MKRTFLYAPVVLSLVFGMCTSLLGAEPQIRWTTVEDGSVKIQVQGWDEEAAPTIALTHLDKETYKESDEKIVLPQFDAMPVKGSWQLLNWNPGELGDGIYRFSIQELAGKGQDKPRQILEDEVTYQSIIADINHQQGVVSWRQPLAGASSILFQFPSGLVLDRILEWETFAAGPQSVNYDLKAADGVNYQYQPNITATVRFIPFAKDIFVKGNFKIKHAKLPEIKNSLKATAKVLEKKGQKLLRVEVTPETLDLLGLRRYEIVVYADGVFIYEEAQGVSPYTYVIPETIANSASSLSINIIDYDGNWGVHTTQLKQK